MDDKTEAEMYKEARGEVRYAIDLISLGAVLLFAVEVVFFLYLYG